MIFEFVIAGVVFFAVMLFMINFMTSNVNDFRTKFRLNKLNSKAIETSEILLTNFPSNLSLVTEWPRLDTNKVNNFNSVYCSNPSGYEKLREDLNLMNTTQYDLGNYINITIRTLSGTLILNCGKPIPKSLSKATVERVVLGSNVAKMRVTVW